MNHSLSSIIVTPSQDNLPLRVAICIPSEQGLSFEVDWSQADTYSGGVEQTCLDLEGKTDAVHILLSHVSVLSVHCSRDPSTLSVNATYLGLPSRQELASFPLLRDCALEVEEGSLEAVTPAFVATESAEAALEVLYLSPSCSISRNSNKATR